MDCQSYFDRGLRAMEYASIVVLLLLLGLLVRAFRRELWSLTDQERERLSNDMDKDKDNW